MFKINKRINKSNNNESKGFFTFIDSTSNLFLLMMKNHFRGSSFWMGNLIIPFFVTLAISILFPITYGFIWMLFINITFTGFITYGILFFSIRKSTIMKNIDMTSLETTSLYSATLLSMLLSTFITFIVLFSSLLIFYYAGIASTHFFYVSDPEKYSYVKWQNIWWSAIVYYWINSVILTFSMSFVIEKIVSTQKNFFLIAFIYLLGGLFFSGIMSNGIYLDGQDHAKVLTVELWNNTPKLQSGAMKSYLWGQPAWFFSQLWPHYGLNQIVFNSLEVGSYTHNGGSSAWQHMSFLKEISFDSKIAYYAIMPWLYSALGYFIGGMLVKYDLKKA